jgi:hypothetical protein
LASLSNIFYIQSSVGSNAFRSTNGSYFDVSQ